MPIHALKIDRSFVARMVDDPMSATIVQTVLTLAAALGMTSIAEGVETAAQADLVRAMNEFFAATHTGRAPGLSSGVGLGLGDRLADPRDARRGRAGPASWAA